MELKLESGLPHQEYAVEAISEVFKQVEINQQVAHYSNPVIDLRSNRFIGNIYRIQQKGAAECGGKIQKRAAGGQHLVSGHQDGNRHRQDIRIYTHHL